MLIVISYDKPNGASCCFSLKDSAEYFYLVRFVSACRNAALSGAATRQFFLYEIHINVNACGHAVYDATDGWAVTFAE
jgi:hypothetical protein